MHTGMLWFDNSQAALTVKIQKAAAYYEKKYGRKPDLCLVHPEMLSSESGSLGAQQGISVRPYRPVTPGHMWIGIEEKPE